LPFFPSVATVAVVGENGNAGNVFAKETHFTVFVISILLSLFYFAIIPLQSILPLFTHAAALTTNTGKDI